MLKFQLITPQDRKEAAAIERRRQAEEERRKRIFNAKQRLIGIDYDALEKQICEKKILELEEKSKNEAYAQQLIRDAEIGQALEKHYKEEKKKIELEIDTFRKLYQKPEDRREFDLNDPNQLKNTLPCRLNDDDPRLGKSSAQKFDGEDPLHEHRRKIQRDQVKAFLEQQIQEKMATEKEYKNAEKEFQNAIIARDCRALELQRIENECKKKITQATNNFNLALLEEKQNQQKQREVEEIEANYAEMYNAMTGDFLTENPAAAESNLGPGRAIGFKYKGMTEEERMAVREIQKKQIDEKKVQKQNENRLEKYWEDYTKQVNCEIQQKDRELRKQKRELEKEIAQTNLKLAKEHREREEYMKRVYQNKLTASYFNSFNTSTR